MVSRQIFRRPMTWVILGAAIIMAVLMSLGYLGAFLSPESHTHHAPFVIVNEDQGATIGGQQANLGDQVLAAITAPNPALGDKVDWIVLPTREDALSRLHDNKAYAAIVIPATYSNEIAALMQPGTTPPAAASIDVLLNSAAGAYPTNLAKQVTTSAVTQVSASVHGQLVKGLGGETAQVPLALAPVVADPVVANTIDAQPTGSHTAGSNSPFYYALLLMLAGFVGMDIIYLGLEMVIGRSTVSPRLERIRGRVVALGPLQAWSTRVILSVILAIAAGILQAWVAIGWLGMATDEIAPLIGFGMLAIFVSAIFTLFFLTAFGTPGLLIAIIIQTFIGAPAARGIFPKEMLPTFYQWAGNLVPLRFIADGVRAIMFYDANGDAGLTQGVIALIVMAILGLILSGLIAWWQDRRYGVRTVDIPATRPVA